MERGACQTPLSDIVRVQDRHAMLAAAQQLRTIERPLRLYEPAFTACVSSGEFDRYGPCSIAQASKPQAASQTEPLVYLFQVVSNRARR